MDNPRKLTAAELLQGTNLLAPSRIIECLKSGLAADQLEFEANKILKNEEKCREISDRICDTEILLCLFYFNAAVIR